PQSERRKRDLLRGQGCESWHAEFRPRCRRRASTTGDEWEVDHWRQRAGAVRLAVLLFAIGALGCESGRTLSDMGGDGSITQGCMTSSGCSLANAPVCNTATHQCHGCGGAADDSVCAAHSSAAPRCGSGGACVACRTDTQSTDCGTGTMPICGIGNACRK